MAVTEVGAAVHVAASVAPVHASATAWLNPPAGVTVTLNDPVAPCATVSDVGAAVRVKCAPAALVPVPVSVTVWGLVESPSVITRFAVSGATTEGLKTTLIVHEAPRTILEPHVFVAV